MKVIFKKPVIFMVIISVLLIGGLAAFVASHGFNKKMEQPDAKPDIVEEKKEQKLTEADSEAVITAVGNCSLDSSIINSLHMLDGSYSYSSPFENISADLQKSDISIVNLCSPLSISSDNGITNIPSDAGAGIADAGFNVFACANGKFLSVGRNAVNESVDLLSDTVGANCVGIYKDEASSKELTVFYKNGISIALLDYTAATVDSALTKDDKYMVNTIDKNNIVKDIENAKKLAEAVIVYIDWDTSYQSEPNELEIEYADIICKAGADVIIGAGTTFIQPIEWIEDKESGNKTLVYYSLGNFFTGSSDTESLTGIMANFTVVRKNGVITVENESAVPIFTHYDQNISNFYVYKLSDYSDKLAKEHYIYPSENFSVDSLKKNINSTLGDYAE